MATLTTQAVSTTGLNPSFGSAGGTGDKVRPGEHTYLHVKNSNASACVVTIDDPRSQNPGGAQAFNPDLSVSVPTSGERLIGPLPASRFAASDGLVDVQYSVTASVTVAAIST